MKIDMQRLVQDADPKKIDWSNFASSYKIYVGPDPGPNGHPDKEDCNASFYTFEIESRQHDLKKWAVTKHGLCLDKKLNTFVYEPMSSSRTKAFLGRCRFKSKEDAFKALQKYLHEWEPWGGGWIKKKDRPKFEAERAKREAERDLSGD